METARNLVDTASKMIYGENQDQTKNTTGGGEPIAGETGSGTAGNATGGEEPISGQTGTGTKDKPYDVGNTTGKLPISYIVTSGLSRTWLTKP